ncbi:hypothetical protein [Paenibacillus glycanilyticus]|uniref:Uncharacterized protein n=1 Tax=Paenibacillus glycanilyticus TaxID=126569 RepID=A0ABQ6G8L2_9BACL|nr:hypothetical protein [Paenibacillus glycanilyticus]GLX66593.1 hypothetical protein MU1_09370 [Paenibacillus glycanilyticus]
MNINLLEWVDKYQIEQRTIEFFWLNFYSYMKEEPEEFREVFGDTFEFKSLKVQVNKIELYIDSWDEKRDFPVRNYGFDYAESYVYIIYQDKNLGVYTCLFTLDGLSFDDFFIID